MGTDLAPLTTVGNLVSFTARPERSEIFMLIATARSHSDVCAPLWEQILHVVKVSHQTFNTNQDPSLIELTIKVGLATSFLAGSKEEWSLVRRHPSEGIFGVQLAGNKPATLVPAAEAIARECGQNVDFVDLNCGCPIDLVFKSGSGSARKFRQRSNSSFASRGFFGIGIGGPWGSHFFSFTSFQYIPH